MSLQKIIHSKIIKIIAVLAIIAIVAVVVRARGSHTAKYETISPKKIDIAQIISITGRVASSQEFDASFEVEGTITDIQIAVGDHILKGQELARLDTRDNETQVRQKEAQLSQLTSELIQKEAAVKREQAELEKLLKGVGQEERSLADAKVSEAMQLLSDAEKQKNDSFLRAKDAETQAKTKVDNAKINLELVLLKADADLNSDYSSASNALISAQALLDDAVNAKTDDLFIDDQTISPKLSFTTTDTQQKFTVETERVNIGKELDEMHLLILNLGKDQEAIDQGLEKVNEYAEHIRKFLIHLDSAINSAASLSSTTAAAYKTSIASARTNANTASTSLSTKAQDIEVQKATNNSAIATANAELSNAKTAQTVVLSENRNLILNAEVKENAARENLQKVQKDRQFALAPAREEDIRAKQAQLAETTAQLNGLEAHIAEARANYDEVVLRLKKNILISPIDGTVGNITGKLGELAKMQNVFARIIADPPYTIEAFVPEVDSSKITLHNKVKITLDSYGKAVIFDGEVVEIDLAETIIDSVPTYKTIIQFSDSDPRIRPGMTANIAVETAREILVIAIPERTIIRKDGKKFVRIVIKESGKERIVETEVETGLRGSDGLVEITRGVKQGDEIVLFVGK